ncbi:hypothetical protein QM012_000376 [Aureobasidium pullulans]|uniref:SIMPL domain-containing protein n=1 Tax=Aureobasidium pullulans TaxID=5580 RepID=A0ABR0TVF4_AURPU
MTTPTTIAVNGIAIIPFKAERALLDVQINSTGFSRSFVSQEVQLSCQRLEDLLRKLSSTQTESPNTVAETAIVAHWSMTDIKTTSHLPTDEYGTTLKNAQRVYSTSISFNIHIRDFTKLGTFSSQISILPYTSIHNLKWAITNTTKKASEKTLRAAATKDALERAKDYAKALGLSAVWPVEVREVQWGKCDGGAVKKGQERTMGMRTLVADLDPGVRDLVFEPEEVVLSMRLEA